MTPHPEPDSTPPVILMLGVSVPSQRDSSLIVAESIDWTVRQGESWVVAGLQGSGKTDFLMMTAGLIQPCAGTYEFLGCRMPIFEADRLQERLRMGMVFETGQLLHHLTVGENIALPLRYHHNLGPADAARQLAPLVEMLELGPWLGSAPGTLGKGWQRRVGLARALALRPEVLVLDNPLGGLDPTHSRWWLALLAELSRGHPWLDGRPMTLVFTVADLRPWNGSGHHFAVLQGRRFIPLGSWTSLEGQDEPALRELLATSHPAGKDLK